MQEVRKLKNSEKIKALKEFLDSPRNKVYFTSDELTEGILKFLKVQNVSLSMENRVPDMVYNLVQNYRGIEEVKQKKIAHQELIQTTIKRIKDKKLISTSIDIDSELSIYLKDKYSGDSSLIYGASGRPYIVVVEVINDEVVISLTL